MPVARDPFEVALRHLERRARTVREMRAHLRGRGYGAEEIDDVLARLSRLGYLDDSAYAARYASSAAEEKPMGRRRAAQELMRRGVSREIVDRALNEVLGPAQEAGALEKALARAIRGAAGLKSAAPDERTRRRVTSYLLRRGFRPDKVLAAVKRWADQTGGRRDARLSRAEEQEG